MKGERSLVPSLDSEEVRRFGDFEGSGLHTATAGLGRGGDIEGLAETPIY